MDLDTYPIYHRKIDVIIHSSWLEKKRAGFADISRNVRLVRKENEGNLPWDVATFA